LISALGGEARLVVSEGRGPRFSPDGKRIAYWKGNPLTGANIFPGSATLWTAVVGGVSRQLATGFDVAASPEWTPDGSRIVFFGLPKSGDPEKALDFWVIPAEGGTSLQTGVINSLYQQHLWYTAAYPGLVAGTGNQFYLPLRMGDSQSVWRLLFQPRTWQLKEVAQRVTYGTEQNLSPSIAGDRLAFATFGETLQVWSVPLDANQGRVLGEPQQLTNSGDSFLPMVTRDGLRLVFVRGSGKQERCIVRDLLTGTESTCAAGPHVNHPVISRDGSQVAYRVRNEIGSMSTMLVAASGGQPEKICQTDCGILFDWSTDGKYILVREGNGAAGNGVARLEIANGKLTGLYHHPKFPLWQAQVSPDSKWVAFQANQDPTHKSIHVAPFREGVPPEQWITVVPADSDNEKPRWSPDGGLLYFTSTRDGFSCIWAQRLNPANMQPMAEPFLVMHAHSAARSLSNVGLYPLEISVAPDRLVYVMGERKGNIWMTTLR
jgi:Tol biopolymer transport system component